jgi:hypothetical protein
MSFRYFKCSGGLNPSTLTLNGTVFVVCAGVPASGETNVSSGELAGIIVGSIVGAFLLVFLAIYARNRYMRQRFIDAVQQQQAVRPLDYLTPVTTRPAQPGVPSANVIPLTPEELARMQV